MSAGAAEQARLEPAAAASPATEPGRPRRTRTLPLLAAVLVAVLSALALPLVPQLQNVTTVQWPAPGTPVESTMLALSPYRPLELRATVPCSPLQAPAAPLFATAPLRGPGAGLGLEVRLADGVLRVTAEGRTLWTGRVPARGCVLRIDAVGDETRVRVGDEQVASVVVDPPKVAALATGLPVGTPGLSVTLVADSRFETSPTLLKKVLLGVAVLAGAACLALLAALDPVRAPRRRRVPLPRVQDGVLLLVLGTWALIGPMLADDGFNVAVADGFSQTGTVGNRYRWYNAPELPFALVQQALVPLLELGRSPWLLRLPSVGAALVTWLLLSRCLLPRLGAGRAAQWLGLVVLLAWWMPYDLGLRPEPWIALASTGVLVLVLKAVEERRLLPLAVGGVLVGLAVACAPSGLLAAAPYVALSSRLLPLLRDRGRSGLLLAAAVVAPGAVTGAVAVFADAGLAALVEATRIHRVIGPTLRWWEEAQRYQLLFSEGDMGAFARRLPVLLLAGALVLLVATRHGTRPAAPDLVSVAAACAALSFVALVLTPSKWSHHFGGLAGYAALVLAGAVLQAPARLRREWTAAPAAAAAVAAAALVAAGFAGPNLWVSYASFGVSPRLPAALQSPLLWLAAGAAAASVHSARRRPGPRSVLPALPGATVVLGLATSVAVMLGTFALSSHRLGDSWSMAGQNAGHLRAADCGMADHVLVLRPSPLVPAVGAGVERQAPAGTFRRGGSHLPAPGNLPPEVPRWGTLRPAAGADAEAAKGTLTSGWYEIPLRPRDTELGVAVSGRTGDGNRVALQYASRSDAGRIVLEEVVREDVSGVDWRYVTFGVTGPVADLVRVVTTDATTGRDGWVATSAPVLMRPTVLRDVLAPGTVSIDFPLSFAYPCAEQVRIAHGLADLPTFSIAPRPDSPSAATSTLEYAEPLGGTLAMARQAAFLTVLPTRFRGQLPEDELLGRGWGTLVRYDYPYATGRYAVTVTREVRSSLDWGYRFPVPVEPDPLDPFDRFDPLDQVDKG